MVPRISSELNLKEFGTESDNHSAYNVLEYIPLDPMAPRYKSGTVFVTPLSQSSATRICVASLELTATLTCSVMKNICT